MSDIVLGESAEIHGASSAGIWKRGSALLLLVVLSPIILIVVLGVLVFLGRPLMFRQERAGLDGRPFTILKFRSLRNAHDKSGRLLDDRYRMTPISALLRRSRLDEIPQLWCVAKGEMSFVGPRPLLEETIRRYGPLGQKRCSVRPGMTGWAQISGNTHLDDETKLALDLWYIEHGTLALDLRVVAMTFGVLLLGEKEVEARIKTALEYLEKKRMSSDSLDRE